MSLNWNFETDKMGELTVVNHLGEERTYNVYRGNALFIILNEYQENGEDFYSLVTFACDGDHLKNMLGLKKGYSKSNLFDNWVCLKLDAEKFPKEAIEIATLLTKGKVKAKIELTHPTDDGSCGS